MTNYGQNAYYFANVISTEFGFVERRTDGSIFLYKNKRDSAGVELNKELFNVEIFDELPINRRCSLGQIRHMYAPGRSYKLVNIPLGVHLEWPYNLLSAVDVVGDSNWCAISNNYWFEMTDDRWKGIEYALSKLTDRERKCIELYFGADEEREDSAKRTYDDLALYFHVTRERIRQILVKAIRKLRNPYRYKYLKYGYEIASGEIERSQIMIRQAEIDRVNQIIDSQISELKARSNNISFEGNAVISIDELNLSVRTYNCLKRANVYTLGDIKKMTITDLSMVRNLGRRSLSELVEKLSNYGITLDIGSIGDTASKMKSHKQKYGFSLVHD